MGIVSILQYADDIKILMEHNLDKIEHETFHRVIFFGKAKDVENQYV